METSWFDLGCAMAYVTEGDDPSQPSSDNPLPSSTAASFSLRGKKKLVGQKGSFWRAERVASAYTNKLYVELASFN